MPPCTKIIEKLAITNEARTAETEASLVSARAKKWCVKHGQIH